MPQHTSSRWSLCIVLLLFIVLAFPISALAASTREDTVSHTRVAHLRAGGQGWQVVPSPNIGRIGSQLSSISAVNANDIWAVGYDFTKLYSNRTLIEHWDGFSWQVVPSPNVGSDINFLYGVAALSANNVWAVGFYRNGSLRTLIEHWDGTQWSVVPSPNVGANDNQLEGIVSLSANNIWAVGTYFNVQKPRANLTLIEHWNGSQWSVVRSPNTTETINDLTAVAALSANNIWAVGYGETPGYITLVEHWNGSKWSIVKSPNVPNSNSTLQGISILAPNNIWAAGFYYDNTSHRDATLIEHWNGSAWSIVQSANNGTNFDRLLAITALSANDVWAVGDDDNGTSTYTLIEHWNGVSWKIVQSPNPGSGFNSLDASLYIAGTTWAVGYYFNNEVNFYETLVERLQ